jgi:thioredoxin-like negative regulator of GroEL
MESLIAHFARKERRRLRVVCVDMDENAELADRLSVENVPTIVLLKEKEAVDRLEGRATGLQIEEMIRAHVEGPASSVFGEAGGVDGGVDTQYPKAS